MFLQVRQGGHGLSVQGCRFLDSYSRRHKITGVDLPVPCPAALWCRRRPIIIDPGCPRRRPLLKLYQLLFQFGDAGGFCLCLPVGLSVLGAQLRIGTSQLLEFGAQFILAQLRV
jgi:hypothetical protein